MYFMRGPSLHNGWRQGALWLLPVDLSEHRSSCAYIILMDESRVGVPVHGAVDVVGAGLPGPIMRTQSV